MKSWLIKVIESCFTPEQVEAAEVLISLYLLRLRKEGKTDAEIKLQESDLLEALIKKNDLLTV